VARAQDEVARLLADWRRERPDVDVSALEVFSRVSRLAVYADRVRASAFREVGLTAWGFDVLAALRRSGAPYQLSPGTLGTQLLVASGTVTHRVDRLATAGLLTREPDTEDRRGVLVTLTAQGRSVVDRALGLLADAETVLLTPLSDTERARLAATLQRLLLAEEAGR